MLEFVWSIRLPFGARGGAVIGIVNMRCSWFVDFERGHYFVLSMGRLRLEV